jgi:hypothetical protein
MEEIQTITFDELMEISYMSNEDIYFPDMYPLHKIFEEIVNNPEKMIVREIPIFHENNNMQNVKNTCGEYCAFYRIFTSGYNHFFGIYIIH